MGKAVTYLKLRRSAKVQLQIAPPAQSPMAEKLGKILVCRISAVSLRAHASWAPIRTDRFRVRVDWLPRSEPLLNPAGRAIAADVAATRRSCCCAGMQTGQNISSGFAGRDH
jgi:hypothetical protein